MSGDPTPARFVRFRGKTYGPFAVDELIRMAKRGQITRMHELSTDSVTWARADEDGVLFPKPTAPVASTSPIPLSQVSQVIAAGVDGASQRTVPGKAAGGDASTTSSAASDEWHYSIDGQRLGPASVETIRHLHQAQQLRGPDLVWRPGMPDWVALENSGILAQTASPAGSARKKSLLSPTLIVAAVMAVTGATLLVLWLSESYRGSSIKNVHKEQPIVSTATYPASTPLEGVTSIFNEETIAPSVGLVVVGCQIVDYQGKLAEVPSATASCFAIAPNGIMLTNKHVVKDIVEMSRADQWKADMLASLKWKIEERLWVFLQGEKHRASVVWVSPQSDIAIIQVDRVFAHPFRLRQSAEGLLDVEVRAIGFPASAQMPISQGEMNLKKSEWEKLSHGQFFNEEDVAGYFKSRDYHFVLTAGRVSQVMRDDATGESWIMHSANISHGNSGGPLADAQGAVVGINTLGGPEFLALAIGQFRADIDKQVKEVQWVR